MINVLGLAQSVAFYYYVLIALVSPISGIVLAGFIFDRFGGYTSSNTMIICFIVGFISTVFGFCSIFMTDANYVALFVFIQLMGGSFIMPANTGFMLN